MSRSPTDPKPMMDRLLSLAITGLVIAFALYFAVHLIEAIAGFLILAAVVVGAVYAAWLWQRKRRSDW